MVRNRGGFGRGAVRTGTRTVNRFAYVFGPVLIFVVVLYVWSVANPSSFNGMVDAVGKFFGAVRGT